VTVVDDHVFAAAIHSQECPATTVDWRVDIPGGATLRHEAVELEPHVAEACRQITGMLGLRYSAIDLIRTTEGGVVFLEVNPNGEWMWLEDACGFPLRDAIIDALTRAA
jgi:glutathione synthase/RimK-type ligase-like ATP-grasp enzyme